MIKFEFNQSSLLNATLSISWIYLIYKFFQLTPEMMLAYLMIYLALKWIYEMYSAGSIWFGDEMLIILALFMIYKKSVSF